MEDKLTKKYKAISIRTFGFIMIVIAFIMTLILQYSIHDIQDENVNAQKMTDTYINGQLSLINMKSSSDDMIERIRTGAGSREAEPQATAERSCRIFYFPLSRIICAVSRICASEAVRSIQG